MLKLAEREDCYGCVEGEGLCSDAGLTGCAGKPAAISPIYAKQPAPEYSSRVFAGDVPPITMRFFPQRFAYGAWVTPQTTTPRLKPAVPGGRAMAMPEDVAFALGSDRAPEYFAQEMKKDLRQNLPATLEAVRQTMAAIKSRALPPRRHAPPSRVPAPVSRPPARRALPCPAARSEGVARVVECAPQAGHGGPGSRRDPLAPRHPRRGPREAEALKLGGHTVEVALSGPEGLEKARAFRPEAVLCDIGLPKMDGYEVARAMRADPELTHVTPCS